MTCQIISKWEKYDFWETIYKFQIYFSRKNKKNIISFPSAILTQRLVTVKIIAAASVDILLTFTTFWTE